MKTDEQPPNSIQDSIAEYELTKRRAAVGGRAMMVRHALWALISLVCGTLLIRRLGPEQWAIYGIAYFLIVAFDNALGANFLGRLVRSGRSLGADDRESSVALMHIVGASTAITLFVVSAPAAALYGSAEFAALLKAVGICTYVYSLRATSVALLERDLRYQTIALAELLDQLTFYAVAFALLEAGFGLDAVVIALAVRGVVPAVLLRVRQPVPIIGRLHRAPTRAILGFGIPTLGSSALILLTGLIPALVLGGNDATELAFVMVAATIIGYAAVPQVVLQRVGFPALSSLAHDPRRFGTALQRTMRFTDTLLVSVIVPLGVLSPLWLPLLLGSEWTDASPILMAVGAGSALNGVVAIGTSGLQALGHPSGALGIQVAMILVYAASALALAPEAAGLGVAVAYAGSRAVGLGLTVLLLSRRSYQLASGWEIGMLLVAVLLLSTLGALVFDGRLLLAAAAVVLVPAWILARRSDLVVLRNAIRPGPLSVATT